MSSNKDRTILITASEARIEKVLYSQGNIKYYPYYVSEEKKSIKVEVPSPYHGRSIIADYDEKTKRFVITKGNGLTYFPFGFVATKELEDNTWGFLRQQDAVRDYKTGLFVSRLGLLTNNMEAVYILDSKTIRTIDGKYFESPTILQYNVISPYRLSDIPYLPNFTINKYLKNWKFLSNEREYHCIAADVFLKNLRVMWDNDVLHNAIHNQNYTMALELVDFELARSPETPYENPEDEKNYKALRNREVIQSLEIVNYLAFQLNEVLNISALRYLMKKYGFEAFL